MAEDVSTRPARAVDDAELHRIDVATCTTETSPAPPPDPGREFFDHADPADTLVAEIDGEIAGWARLGPFYDIPASRHVLEVRGFAVDPAWQRRGTGRALLDAVVVEARRRGARKLMLRVLGSNARARRLYESAGFHVEGVLRAQFVLDGRDVDDVLMAREL
jgi:ribosomal protein S18 acetylase RimI-like enzyme